MKKIALFLALISMISVSAQRLVEESVALKSNQEIFLDFKFAEDIKVENWNKNELLVKVSVNIDDGEGNDAFNLLTEENSGVVEMRSDFGTYFKEKNKKDRNYWTNDTSTEIIYTVYVPINVHLKIKSISGDVTINDYKGVLITDLIAGNVTIKNYDGELHLKTISGDVDVVLKKANVNAKTLTGTIYANVDIDLEGGEKRSGGHNNIKGKINSGGTLVKMETISGDIFLRKS